MERLRREVREEEADEASPEEMMTMNEMKAEKKKYVARESTIPIVILFPIDLNSINDNLVEI